MTKTDLILLASLVASWVIVWRYMRL